MVRYESTMQQNGAHALHWAGLVHFHHTLAITYNEWAAIDAETVLTCGENNIDTGIIVEDSWFCIYMKLYWGTLATTFKGTQ